MNKKIAILVNAPGFNWANANSAVAQYLKQIGDGLEKAGYSVSFYPESCSKNAPIKSKASNRNFKKVFVQFVGNISRKTLNSLKFRKYFKSVDLETKYLSQNLDVDLVIEFLCYGSTAGAEIKLKKGCKLIVVFDSPLSLQFKEMHKGDSFYTSKINRAEAKSLEMADSVICYSNAVADFIRNEFQYKNQISQIPCILWKKPVERVISKKRYIGFVGSFLNWHKVELLIQSFNNIANDFPDLELVLLGYGEEWEKINALRIKSPFLDRIIQPGFVSESELSEWKSKFTIGVMPGSNWYGSPLKLFEYAESGIPFISPETPTVNSFFEDKKHTLFIDSKNEVKSLSNACIFLLNNPELAEKMGKNAQELMKTTFSYNEVMRTFVNTVEQTIHEK